VGTGLSEDSGRGGRLTRPLLATERLRLEPLTLGHTDAVVAIDADPEVMRFLTGHERPRDEGAERWLPHMTDPALDARGLGFWVGHVDDEPVGWWCLAPRGEAAEQEPDTAWLGFRLLPSARGRGYATEGARALLAHGFETVGLDKVRAETMAVNTPARAVLERLGLHSVQTYVGAWEHPLPGWEQGEVVYLITEAEWRLR
jgi:RimJ/RimL family protein N-acetyltransferase